MITESEVMNPVRKMRWLRLCVLQALIAMLITPPSSLRAAPAGDIAKLKVDSAMAASEADLVKRADLIVYGWLDSGQQEAPTGERISGHQVVNYVQTMHVKRLLKGTSGPLVKLLTAGLVPLPEPRDPLTKRFTGPLAEGNYVCFLRQAPNTPYFTLVGLWQGVYPVYREKTIALEETGFPGFANMTIAQLEAKIKSRPGVQ